MRRLLGRLMILHVCTQKRVLLLNAPLFVAPFVFMAIPPNPFELNPPAWEVVWKGLLLPVKLVWLLPMSIKLLFGLLRFDRWKGFDAPVIWDVRATGAARE